PAAGSRPDGEAAPAAGHGRAKGACCAPTLSKFMSSLPLALSLSSRFTELGAVVAFIALFGIAVLSLLVFSQAREIKRLREWAGRAPERAAELEQRVTAQAAARLSQPVPQSVPRGMAQPIS